MAVAEWYSQKEFFDYDTGKPVKGKEEEAHEFMQVIYQDTESVGFGIVEPYVVGWYCPKADLEAAGVGDKIKKPDPASAVT